MSFLSSDVRHRFKERAMMGATLLTCKHCPWRTTVNRRNALARFNVAAGEMRRHAATCTEVNNMTDIELERFNRIARRWALTETEKRKLSAYLKGSQTAAEWDALAERVQAAVTDINKETTHHG